MPRNTGGRRAGAGSQSMLNYKGMPDYDAGNVNVQKNLHVMGHSALNNVNAKNITVDNLTVTNANLSTFEVPVVTGAPSTLPSSAGLITVDNTAGSGLMYFSRLDATAATTLATATTDNTAVQAVTAADPADDAADVTSAIAAATPGLIADAITNSGASNLAEAKAASAAELARLTTVAANTFEWIASNA